MPQTIDLSPSQEEIDAASQIFQLNEDGTFKVNLPTGRESKVSTQTEDNQMTQVDTEGNVDTTTSTAPVQTFGDSISNQVSDFEQRGIQQAQNITPQTLAEKMAVNQAGKLESRLYQNRLGMTTYVLGQYSPDGKTWNATQAVPQGYYPSKAGASYLVQQAAAAGQDNVVMADEGVLVDGEEEEETGAEGEEETNTEDDGATVTVGNQQFTKEQVAQGQADLTAGAILNAKDTVGAAAVDAQNADTTGTVMGATTGQANTTAPVVDDVSQVATVTTATTPNKPNLAKADLAQGTATVKDELKDVEAQQGTVTKNIEAQTQDTTKVGDQQAAQGTAAKVEGAPTRNLEEGEMIDGSAVDQTKVGETFGT